MTREEKFGIVAAWIGATEREAASTVGAPQTMRLRSLPKGATVRGKRSGRAIGIGDEITAADGELEVTLGGL